MPSARRRPSSSDGRAIDADVHMGGAKQPLHLRLVGVQTPKGYGFFLTNLPPRLGPLQVADLYRGRWEVELSIRLDKSVNRLDEVDTEQPGSLKTLLYASLMASTIAALLAHTHHLKTRPVQAGVPRTEAPLHPRRLALQLAASCQSIAEACQLTGRRGQAPVGEDRRIAHPFRQRPSLAPSTVGPGSVTRLEAAAHCSKENQPP